MRNAFASEIVRLTSADQRIVVLAGDIGNTLFDELRRLYPQRWYNAGIAEQNMIGAAAGLALSGMRPIVYTITPFATFRCLEQIRVDVCYHDLPVVIVGTGSGLAYASLGPTHHSCEDVAMMRTLPGMTVVCPADPVETRLALHAAFALGKPAYLRLGKAGEPTLYKEPPQFIIGKAISLRTGMDVCIIASGPIVSLAIDVAERLASTVSPDTVEPISCSVSSFHTVKPLDAAFLAQAFASFKLVVTIEEHSLIGGLGSAVAEWLADNPSPGRLLRFGTADRFVHAHSQREAWAECGLTVEAIAERIGREMAR